MEVWARKANLLNPFGHVTGALIAAGQAVSEGVGVDCSIVHLMIYDPMLSRPGRFTRPAIVSAEWEGVVELDPTTEIETYTRDGSRIYRYGLLPLNEEQEAAKDTWLSGMIGKPYGVLHFASIALSDLAKIAGLFMPPVIKTLLSLVKPIDLQPTSAYICSKLVAAFGNEFYGWGVDEVSFVPAQIAGLVKAKKVVYLGEANLHSDPVAAPPH